MAEIVNLNRARKARLRTTAAAEAAANRVKHGRTPTERANDAAETARRNALLDGVRADPARQTAERTARDSYGRLLALLSARGGDLAAAEDALGDAFAAALEHWPRTGVPAQPEAWLLTAARRRLTDGHRRRATAAAGTPELLRRAGLPDDPAELPDHRLALLLACADPAVEPTARAPLMLQVVLGLDAARIAGAFLMSPVAMAQRLVRAKRRLRDSGARFTLPDRDTVTARLPPVLDAIYAAYAAGAADPALGGGLAGEAEFLAQLCAGLAPAEPEAAGLAALLLHLEARRPAGRGAAGEYIPLDAQDPARWDGTRQSTAELLLRHAATCARPGRYQLEAAIASVHAERRRTGGTDWGAIVTIYDALLDLTGSPVVAVNRAVAIGRHLGPEPGRAALDAVAGDPRLAEYQPFWAARVALAATPEDAASARLRAAGLAHDPAVRAFLLG